MLPQLTLLNCLETFEFFYHYGILNSSTFYYSSYPVWNKLKPLLCPFLVTYKAQAPLAQLVEQLTLNQLKQVLSEFEFTLKNPPLKTRVFHLHPIVSNY